MYGNSINSMFLANVTACCWPMLAMPENELAKIHSNLNYTKRSAFLYSFIRIVRTVIKILIAV